MKASSPKYVDNSVKNPGPFCLDKHINKAVHGIKMSVDSLTLGQRSY